MANDRSDFDPEIRRSAWWSGDSRLAADGRGNDAVLRKLGLMEEPDLSGVEAVQMGHIMQPVIGRLAQEKLGIELKDADYMLSHPKESWLRSHFDFISSDGQVLVEAKNYSAHSRRKFDAEMKIVPPADMAQIIHEAAVHGVNRVVLAVLFGGQNFECFDFTIEEARKDELIREMAKYWAAVQTRDPLPPESAEQTKAMYTTATDSSITADARIEQAVEALKQIRIQISDLEEHEERIAHIIQSYMKDHSALVGIDGSVLATWKNTKPSKRFDFRALEAAMPDIFRQFTREVPGSRRFLVK
jgi:predicted phage-related endonuclease